MNKYKRQFSVNSFTHPDKKPYKISECFDGQWQCSCPAWTFHTPRRNCKHITKTIQSLRIVIAANPTWSWAAPRARQLEAQAIAVQADDMLIRPRPLDEIQVEAAVPQRQFRSL